MYRQMRPITPVALQAVAMLMAVAGASASGNPDDLLSLSVEQLSHIKVSTAALHDQEIKDAPADMTLITAEDIRRYGWRTLGEILNHVRGFYMTWDHTYQEAGTAGYSIPGDWSTRILVLVNGHNMTDNIFGSASYFDQDFVIDMTLVDRIEIVRGTSSSLYGSNGILATINVITKRPGSEAGASLRAEAGTLGEKRATATASYGLPRGISLIASGTLFNDAGQHDIYFPQYDTPATNNGNAVGMDGDRGYRFFLDATAGNWEILAFAGARVKTQPISWVDTIFNDPGTRATDERTAVVVSWTRQFAGNRTLRWANSWDDYLYRGTYLYPLANDDVTGASGIDTNKEYDNGRWLTSVFTYRLPFLSGNLTAGGEGKLDLRALQSEADVLPVYNTQLYVNKRDKAAAGFVQQEWKAWARWDFTMGGRYDWSYYRNAAFSPRGGVVFHADRRTTIKLIYGRGFRNPNANELYFSAANANVANPSLKPEEANSIDLGVYRDIGRHWTLGITADRIVDNGVIVPIYTTAGASEFVNSGSFHGIGLGGEIQGKPFRNADFDASFQQQQSWLENRATLPNSPRGLGKVRVSIPLKGSPLLLSGGLLYESERRTLADARLQPVWLPELTLVTKNLPSGVDIQAGVRNLSNTRYVDPAGLTPSVDTIVQPGRTYFVTVRHRF